MSEQKAFIWENFVKGIETKLFPLEKVETDDHVKYLFDYLDSKEIGAKTIVVEPEYVDGDFLEDFASYYVSCFAPYERFCKRLHFFSRPFENAEWDSIIGGSAEQPLVEAFRATYLGFIVVKPLPDAIIGRTQIKTYGPDGGRRQYTALVDYDVHLFGVDLSVRSLAFQEQDRALAACATVALWSCFQRTSRLFGTPASRPPKITMDATMSFYDQRSLPSSGLYIEQICSSIRMNGLDPEVFSSEAMKNAPIVSLIYAYVKMGLPVLLVVDVEGLAGGHAVTICGYSFRDEVVHATELSNTEYEMPVLAGRHIDEFYAHDDQRGPFSRLEVISPKEPGESLHFRGSWVFPEDGRYRKLVPTNVIVPVYPKIRLDYFAALKWIIKPFDITTKMVGMLKGVPDLEWDVHLTTTNDYKASLRQEAFLNPGRMAQVLTSPQPRFFWRCILKSNGKPLLEVLIDATGFSRSFPIQAVNFFDMDFADGTSTVINIGAEIFSKDFRSMLRRELDDRYGPRLKSASTSNAGPATLPADDPSATE